MKRFQDLINKSKDINKLEPENSVTYYLFDMMIARLFYGFSLDEYRVLELYNYSLKDRKKLVTRRDRDRIIKKYNNLNNLEEIENKSNFLESHQQYIGREYFIVSNSTLADFKLFASRHTKIIAKHGDGSQGRGINIYHVNQYEDVSVLYEELKYLKYDVLEELISPHRNFKQINKYGLPVMRVMTFLNSDNRVEILGTSLTVSIKDPIVNNNRDGLKMIVDPDQGQVISYAANGKKYYTTHPITGQLFKEFQIPYWTELIELSKELAQKNRDFRYVGWDMAVTEKGPVVIEANAKDPGVTSMQYPCYRGVANFYEQHSKLLTNL